MLITNISKDELKACPFCGGKCELNSNEMGAAREIWYFVWCPKCLITGGLRKSSNDALEFWNKRVN